MKKYFDYFENWEKFIKFDENYRKTIYDSDEKLMELGFEFFKFAGIDIEMLEKFEEKFPEIDKKYKDDARRYSVDMRDLYGEVDDAFLEYHIQDWITGTSDKYDCELLDEAREFEYWIGEEMKKESVMKLGGLYDLLYEAQRSFYEEFIEDFLVEALEYMKHYKIKLD